MGLANASPSCWIGDYVKFGKGAFGSELCLCCLCRLNLEAADRFGNGPYFCFGGGGNRGTGKSAAEPGTNSISLAFQASVLHNVPVC